MYDRYELVEMVKGQNPLELPYYNMFKITYTIDSDIKERWIFAPYSSDTMEVVCAYIQIKGMQFNLFYDMNPSDMVDILKFSYNAKDLKTVLKQQPHLDGMDYLNYSEIDLYVNWEIFAPLSDRILEIASLDKNDLETVLLLKIADYFKNNEKNY